MRSLKVSGACSTTGESVGISLDQPTPGPFGVRSDSREDVSEPQQEDILEDVVMLEEDDDVFLEEEEEKKEEKRKEMEKKKCFSRFL